MASIKTGSIVADISGKVGDQIYSRNRAGLYVRSFTSPIQPNSQYQLSARQLMIDANLAWNNLSELDYNNWFQFSKNFKTSYFNDSKLSVDARSFFIKCYIYKNRANVGGNPLPVFPSSLNFESIDIDFSDPLQPRVILKGGFDNSSFSALLYSNIPQSTGVRSLNSISKIFYASIDYAQGVALNTSPTFTSRFSGWPVLSSKRLFFQAKIIHKLSGIKVGSGWNNKIKEFTPDPYLLGVTTATASGSAGLNPISIPVTTTLAGQIFGISVISFAGGGNIKVGIYSDLAGKPNVLLANSSSLSFSPANSTIYFPFLSPFLAAATTNYHLVVSKDTTSRIGGLSGSGAYLQSTVTQFNLPNPFGLTQSKNTKPSIFCEVVP